jgi:hypothetical protein
MIRLTNNPAIVLLLAAACCCLAGCGGAKKGQLPTAQVTGQVTYRGAPLSRGTIKFIPVRASGKETRVAHGVLDEQGRYCLGTTAPDDGALPGDYEVAVESRVEPPDVAHATKLDLMRPKSLIPARYADPRSSRLTAHVVSGGNTVNFELKD